MSLSHYQNLHFLKYRDPKNPSSPSNKECRHHYLWWKEITTYVVYANVYKQAGQRTRNLPLGPRSQMGYKSWAPGYRDRLTVFTFIFYLLMFIHFGENRMKALRQIRENA